MCHPTKRAPPPLKQTAKMPTEIGKAIIRLINAYPPTIGKLWLSASEQRDYLVIAGVDKDISVDHILYIIQYHNRNGKYLDKNEFGREYGSSSKHNIYYRHIKYTDESTPKTDHFRSSMQARRNLPRPTTNYFLGEEKCAEDINLVNEWFLEGYLALLDGIAAREEDKAMAGAEAETEAKAAAEKDGKAKQTDEQASNSREVEGDGFAVTRIDSRRDFVLETSTHAGECGDGAVVSYTRSIGHGSAIEEYYHCSKCHLQFEYRTCHWPTTEVPARGRSCARPQPETNVKIVKAARQSGTNLRKARELFTGSGIIMPAYRNMLPIESKIRTAIENLSEKRLEENRREHCIEARRQDDYAGDMVWTNDKGVLNSTSRGPISMDGGGLTRAYNHRIKGAQAAFIVFSLVTHMPIAIVHTQVSCNKCTRALNKAKRAGQINSSTNKKQHMAHNGTCYRNSKHGPAVAEEPSAMQAAEELLIGPDGNYLGDDTAIFVDIVVSDNDTRAPSGFISKQAEIIGSNAADVAEHVPDIGHLIKICSNALYKIRETDPSFRGRDLLENNRIRCLMGDVKSALRFYSPFIGDAAKRTECANRIYAIVPHHCGDHSKCSESVCQYLQIKRRNPAWINSQVEEEYAKHNRFNGRYMSLSSRGSKVVCNVLFQKFDESNLDRAASLASSNDSEGFFGRTAVLSEGKRISLDQTDMWKSMLLLSFCYCGNEETTKIELSKILGLSVTKVEEKASAERAKKRKQDHDRICSPEGAARRKDAKLTKAERQGREDPKMRHMSGKVPLKQSAKTSATKRQRTVKPCSSCKKYGHTAKDCPMPPEEKYGKGLGRLSKKDMPELLDW